MYINTFTIVYQTRSIFEIIIYSGYPKKNEIQNIWKLKNKEEQTNTTKNLKLNVHKLFLSVFTDTNKLIFKQ